jgi:hypothetical protein
MTDDLGGIMYGSHQKVGCITFKYHVITILYSVYLTETKMVSTINWDNQGGKRLASFRGMSRHHQNEPSHACLSNGSQFLWDFLFPTFLFIVLALLLMP